MSDWPIHGTITGPIVMIGFGSIGRGTLPLIERHFEYDKSRFVIIDPHDDGALAKQHGVRFIQQGVTRDNYRELLVPWLINSATAGVYVIIDYLLPLLDKDNQRLTDKMFKTQVVVSTH